MVGQHSGLVDLQDPRPRHSGERPVGAANKPRPCQPPPPPFGVGSPVEFVQCTTEWGPASCDHGKSGRRRCPRFLATEIYVYPPSQPDSPPQSQSHSYSQC